MPQRTLAEALVFGRNTECVGQDLRGDVGLQLMYGSKCGVFAKSECEVTSRVTSTFLTGLLLGFGFSGGKVRKWCGEGERMVVEGMQLRMEQ